MKQFSIRKLQLVELEILKEFIKVCEKLELTYFLAGGTLIGAVRHGGFIPWDDDIDVMMPREDYEKFINKGQEYLSKEYFLQNYKTDPEFVLNFSKIRNSETTFIETTTKKRKINHGVYIDIFPIDGMPKSRIEYFNNKVRNTLYNFQVSKYFSFDIDMKRSFKGKIVYIFSEIIYGRKTLREIQDKKEKMYSKYNYKKSDNVISYNGIYGDKEISPKNYFENGVIKIFEGIEANIPNKYDMYLRNIYGDYMKLPPEEKRVAHHYNEIIDLDKSYINYI